MFGGLMMNRYKWLTISFIGASLSLAFSNCSGFRSVTGDFKVLSSNNGSSVGGGPIGGGAIIPIAGSATIGVSHFGQIYTSLKNLTCVTNPSADLVEEQYILNPIYSQNGLANSVSQTTLTVTMRISSKFCEEAYTREANIASANRCVYKNVNYQAGPEQFNSAALEALTRDITRRFWSKTISSEELAVFMTGLNNIANASTASGAEKVRQISVVACTLAFNSINGLAM